MGFCSEWGAQFPTPNSTALDAPPGYMTLYVVFFQEGNFHLPMTKFCWNPKVYSCRLA
ncbi:hypothetical protein Hanom_Chr00s004670g01724371 [Helianthus anomalus]